MPVITVSRQFGSHGDAIVDLLCDRLGYRSLDRGLMRTLAARAGLKPKEVAGLSEDQYQPRTLLERFASTGPATRHPWVWSEYGAWVGREQMAAAVVTQLIEAAHESGNVVVVGRGAQVILRGKPDVLHVRLVAPLALRIRRHQVRAGLTAEAAHEQVLQADRASAEFVRRYTHADLADPALYDLIINTARLPLAAAADLIITSLAALPACA